MAICSGAPVCAQVVINEVSAANWDPVNLGGEYEDWVELYNAGGQRGPERLAPERRRCRSRQVDGARQHFHRSERASGDACAAGRTRASSACRTPNFKLTQTKQESVVLSDPAMSLIDSFQFAQPTQKNHSWGRTADGAVTWSIFLSPTPAAVNTGPSSYYAETPLMSPVAGGYAGSTSVSIAVPAGCTVRYTLDGEEPTAASTLYAGPFNVNATTCVRAVAFSATPGVPPSFIETSTYFINETHTRPVWSIAAGADVT
ncbi:MAG: chitobiase/beta-hexosaminidase C-terminal domain-containing protein [Flavobacteriales bacterium]|nr:chitobiase/beta-hexosaminidase C-terminal domain-containing protein [Flavobacteriales bacterium]